MKFPRCIRLDASDLNIYARAAEPAEWLVPGGFAYADCDPEGLDRKARLAFHSAWLGTESFGHGTLAEVAEIDQAGFEQVVEAPGPGIFVESYGAPGPGGREARPPAPRPRRRPRCASTSSIPCSHSSAK